MSEMALFDTDDTLTVGQVTRRLSETIKRTFSKEIWVQGQIRNLSRSGRGHVYFDLCDPVAAGAQPKASIAVTLFDSNRQIVNRVITRTGNNVRIDDGVEVRIRASVEMYVPRGQLQLNMTSIDPEFTLGRLGADRDQLLRALKAQGLIDANAQVRMPIVPLRLALVTSEGSAAHADFAEQLASSGYAFSITVLATRVQGEFAPEEIASMITRADTLDVDAIAVVRGGGARTDLAAFDTEPVARAIAASTRPVLCGIGHEIDSSVADMVCHASFKTPTACAQFLVDQIGLFDIGLRERADRLRSKASVVPAYQHQRIVGRGSLLADRVQQRLRSAESAYATASTNLDHRVSRAIARSKGRLDVMQTQVVTRASSKLVASHHRNLAQSQRLAERPRRALDNATHRLALLEAKLSAVDPAQALQRGYSVTTTSDGRLVRHSSQVSPGDALRTRLAAGTVTSTVSAVDLPPSTSEESP